MLALTGCPDDGVPQDTEGSSSGDPTSTGPSNPTTTTDPDTTIGLDSSSDGGSAICDPPCADDECCVGDPGQPGTCFGQMEPTCSPACSNTEVCQYPDGVDACDGLPGECVSCGTDPGGYDPCADVSCPDGSVCITDDPMLPSYAICAPQGCGEDQCACPLPDSGTAPNACGELGGDDGGGSCFLDCTGGETCPEGMECITHSGQELCAFVTGSTCCIGSDSPGCDDMTCQDTICAIDPGCCDVAWDDVCAGLAEVGCLDVCPGGLPPLEPWGDCVNSTNPCPLGDTCVSRGEFGFCSTVFCADDMDCAPAPPGGDAPVACLPVLQDGMGNPVNACVIDCAMGQTCPDGMICGLDMFCAWEIEVPTFENCGLSETVCAADEICLSDGGMMMDPTWAVCGQQMCMDVMECQYDPPPGGDAAVVCADPTGMGGDNVCYLDCADGMTTCPDGMICINDSWCAWPQGTPIFFDDFETGDFSMGWTLNNADGFTPNMNVSFVNDAWVVADVVGGPNFSAYSTSWYEPINQSDDWMISPPIMLGANSRVYWQAFAQDPNFPDGYEVRISTAGTSIGEFNANPPLFGVPIELSTPAARFIDLAAAGYADQQVHLAWRNITLDGFLLLVDNVAVVDVP
ncbi:MAG: choice-of-anchor J domain-containing protein [Myxococcota bacterium]